MSEINFTADELLKAVRDSINQPMHNREIIYTHANIHTAIAAGQQFERERIINLLIDLKAIRRDAFGDLVAFNISGDEVIYLTGLEKEK